MFGQLDFQYFWFDAIQDKLKMVGGKRQVLQEAFQDTCLNTTELSVYPWALVCCKFLIKGIFRALQSSSQLLTKDNPPKEMDPFGSVSPL